MYAVVRTGGKQYRVKEGDTLRVEKLEGKVGDAIELKDVIFIGDVDVPTLGKPTVAGAKIAAAIVQHGKARKVFNFRKRKEGWKKIRGHRQPFTALKITKIAL